MKEMDDSLYYLSGKFVLRYVMETGLPNILIGWRNELKEGANFTTIDLLHENGLTKLTFSNIYRWMEALGYKYNERKKYYYVDNHESQENVIYRKKIEKILLVWTMCASLDPDNLGWI